MKRIFIYCALPLLTAACGRSGISMPRERSRLRRWSCRPKPRGASSGSTPRRGDVLEVGRQVGAIDTVQLYLQKLQLERQRASVVSNRPPTSPSRRHRCASRSPSSRPNAAASKTSSGTAPPRPKQLDDIDAQIKVLNGQLEAQLSTLRNNAASIDENSSSIDLQIARIEDQLAKCRIASPVAGTVLAKYSEAGELASVGRPLMKVADLDRIYLRAYFTSDQLAGLKLGQEVTVTADFGGDSRIDYPGASCDRLESEFTPRRSRRAIRGPTWSMPRRSQSRTTDG